MIDDGVVLDAKGTTSKIELGDQILLGRQSILSCNDAQVRIGNFVSIGPFCFFACKSRIEIGSNVSIGSGAQLMAGGHVFDDPDIPVISSGTLCQGITIEDGAWIGTGAIVLDGVSVGRNSIVGAGAVVSKDVPAWTLRAGKPSARSAKAQRDGPVSTLGSLWNCSEKAAPEKTAVLEEGRRHYLSRDGGVHSTDSRPVWCGDGAWKSELLWPCWRPNCAEFVISYFAIVSAGAIVQPLDRAVNLRRAKIGTVWIPEPAILSCITLSGRSSKKSAPRFLRSKVFLGLALFQQEGNCSMIGRLGLWKVVSLADVNAQRCYRDHVYFRYDGRSQGCAAHPCQCPRPPPATRFVVSATVAAML